MEENLLKIINHYGIKKQLKYIHREYSELDEAIIDDDWAKYNLNDNECLDYHNGNKKHIAEELADVMVMLKQFQYYYDITDEQIENIMKQKIERQLKRIEEEK